MRDATLRGLAEKDLAGRLLKASGRSEVPPFMVMDVMAAAARIEAAGGHVIHMEVGQPAASAPKTAIAAAHAALDQARIDYTSALGIPSLRARIARHYRETYGCEVDAERIGAIGHSLGGHNSLFVAAFDERVRAIVSSCGFCSFPRYYDGNLAGWSHAGYMPRIRDVYELNTAKMPFDFTEVLAVLAPRPFLAIAPERDANFSVAGVRECVTAARPVYELFGAADRLAASYPDCEHDFPPVERERAYAWFDRWLRDAEEPAK